MAKKVKKKELGLGIKALLGNMDLKSVEQKEDVVKELASAVALVSIEVIEVNPFQPRTDFDEDGLNELAASLKIHGLIQPITVRRMGDNQYQIISGERRFRASKLAGLEEIPAYIRIANDQEMLEMAIVENIQREQLNPMEVAFSYQRLIDECNLTHEAMAERVGKNRSSVTNYLRLLKLPPDVQSALKKEQISMGHARAIAGIEDITTQLLVLKECVVKELSVRAVEELIRSYQRRATSSQEKKSSSSLPADYLAVRNRLGQILEAKVELKLKGKDKGSFSVQFDSVNELNRILELLEEIQ